ncbi:MAG: hypothetical protein QXH65_04765 [Thermofilaceae archaeon]
MRSNLKGLIDAIRARTNLKAPYESAALAGGTWLSEIPKRIGRSLRDTGVPGVVRYDGFIEGFHIYSVFCRLNHRAAVLRLAYRIEKTGEVKLAAVITEYH